MMQSGWDFPDAATSDEARIELPAGGKPFALLYDGVAPRAFLLSDPVASLLGTESGITLDTAGQTWAWPGNPLENLDRAFSAAALEGQRGRAGPCCFAGAFHYDLRRSIERHSSPAHDEFGLPWLRWFLFSKCRHASPDELSALMGPVPRPGKWATVGSLDQRGYEEGVSRIVDLEHAGEVYQVNLTRRLTTPFFGDALALWWKLAATARAPFSAYFDAGPFQILSLSPERFLRRRGDGIWTEPIKGTIGRGLTPRKDASNLTRLLAGEKEAAELAMIVDVERNDLGRVAVPGSVRVSVDREVLSLPTVHHLYSRVEAVLKTGMGVADILRATFPGGSVTGAPKIRAMEIIDRLEPVSRGYYCGALGWMDTNQNLDWNLPIRTATAMAGNLHFGVGGGIVADSDPAAEWEETLAKAKCFVVEGG